MNEHTSQQLSQRLWNAGYRGEHTHAYVNNTGKPVHTSMAEQLWPNTPHIPAYTFSELWGVLPEFVNDYKLFSKKSNGEMFIGYHMPIVRSWKHWFCTESPAEAVGLLVEWLITEGHMEVAG